jgi:hypothetical protein
LSVIVSFLFFLLLVLSAAPLFSLPLFIMFSAFVRSTVLSEVPCPCVSLMAQIAGRATVQKQQIAQLLWNVSFQEAKYKSLIRFHTLIAHFLFPHPTIGPIYICFSVNLFCLWNQSIGIHSSI